MLKKHTKNYAPNRWAEIYPTIPPKTTISSAVRTSVTVLLISFLFVGIAAGQKAQNQNVSYTGISLTANVPSQPLGLDIRGVSYREISYFGQIKTSRPPPDSETYDDLSENSFPNDSVIDSRTVHFSLSAGLTYGITKSFHLWGGAGLTSGTEYTKLNDRFDILGDSDGNYWVHSNESGSVEPKVLGGIGTTFDSENWSALLGGESNPAGVNLAVGFTF